MSPRTDSTRQPPFSLPPLTIGFCTDIAGEERLAALAIERIWRRGDGAITLEDALYDFRGRAGGLAITNDLRIFGLTQRDINKQCAALIRGGIEVIDIDHPEQNLPELQQRAFSALHASKPIRSHRVARRRGRMGGLAKAAAAGLARDVRCAGDIVGRLCEHPSLTWDDCAAILGPPFSKSTLQRICQR